jgi:hypothetical protein
MNKKPKEKVIQAAIMLEATKLGARLFRNQVGVYHLADGRTLSSGLCFGSADLIGWTKTGRFLSVEVKRPGGKPSAQQIHWMEQVNKSGGLAGICWSVEDVRNLLQGEQK